MADENETEGGPPSPMLGLLYVVGGMAFVLIGLMLGFGDILAWSLSLALLIVGATGMGAGGMILWRTVRERQKMPK